MLYFITFDNCLLLEDFDSIKGTSAFVTTKIDLYGGCGVCINVRCCVKSEDVRVWNVCEE